MANTQLFGITYLETEDFRLSQSLFGAGMAMCDYANTTEGNLRLLNVLAAASRMIDAFCGRDFSPAAKTEQQKFTNGRQFQVNCFPVAEIIQCKIKFTTTFSETLPVTDIYVNNQAQYLEITALNQSQIAIESHLVAVALEEPVIEIIYTSYQSIEPAVRLACGYQAAHLINSGFVDKMMPPNFGKLDMSGLSINNKKGYKSAEEKSAGSMNAEAERLLAPYRSLIVA